MKYLQLVFLGLGFHLCCAAQLKIPSHFKQKKSFTKSVQEIIHEVGLDSVYDAGSDGQEKISFAVIDLTGRKPVFAGVNADNFIYPASVYKMYVAMEVLKQASEEKFSLFAPYIVRSPNDVDKGKQIDYDPRTILKNNDTVTINYLLDLMITRSDNSAANCLIDVATRPAINKTMNEQGWKGSEVTRKFLPRKFEDPGYDTVRGTETSALHAADFMYKIYRTELINPWVSMQLKALLGRQLDTTKLSAGLPGTAMFYHKTGWWNVYTNDVGIVEDGKIKYVIAVFIPLKEELARPKMKNLSRRVYELIYKLHH